MTDVPTSQKVQLLPPPGLAPPPGLEAFADQPHEMANNRSFKYGEGVVSQQLQQQLPQTTRRPETHKMERGGPWRTSQLHPWRSKQEPASLANDPLVGLKEAISKLAPADIATVKSLLDSKIRDDTPIGTAPKVQLGGGRGQRLFTPFGKKPPFAQRSDLAHMKAGRDHLHDSINEAPGDSLRSFLYDLAQVDDNPRVLSVRRINRLGFDSPKFLQAYFAKFGTVERVMVAHTTVKAKTPSGQNKARPAPLGFVVMSKAEEVQAALKLGEAHTLEGVEITVQSFQSHSIDATD